MSGLRIDSVARPAPLTIQGKKNSAERPQVWSAFAPEAVLRTKVVADTYTENGFSIQIKSVLLIKSVSPNSLILAKEVIVNQEVELRFLDNNHNANQAGQQVLAVVAPLDGLDEVVLIRPRRHVIVNLRQADVPELNQGLWISHTCALQHAVQSSSRSTTREGHSLRTQQIVVPYVHKHITSAARCQQPLVRVPLGEEYLAVVFADHAYALSVGDQRYLIGQCVLCAILLYAIVLRKGNGLDL